MTRHDSQHGDARGPIIIPKLFDKAKDIEIKEASAASLEEIYRSFLIPYFPANEVKPLESIIRMMEEGQYSILAAYLGGKIVGCALMTSYPDGEIMLLDYLAVSHEYRGRGIGGMLLKKMSDLIKDKIIVLETETLHSAENDAQIQQRTKRNAFYSANGLTMDKDLVTCIFGAEYNIWTFGDAKCDLKAELTRLYRYMVHDNKLYEENITI